MADKKVSQLTALTGANTASGDLLYIVDVSEPVAADQSKKITLTEFQSAPVSAGTANAVLYLNGSKVPTSSSALTFNGTTLATTGALTVDGNTILGDASTDTVRVNGYMGVGGAGTSNAAVYLASIALTGTSQYGFYSTPRATSAATAQAVGFAALVRTEDAAFTLTNAYGVSVENASKGASSTITNQHGVRIADQTQGTNNFGITSLVSSGTDKWNIYASGTAANYFAGNVGIGTSLPLSLFNIQGSNATVYTGSGSTTSPIDDAVTLFVRNTSNTSGTMAMLQLSPTSGTGVTQHAYIGSVSVGGQFSPAIVIGQRTGSATWAERLRIDSSGNLGIGTTSPDYKLQVSGTTGQTFSIERVASSIGSSTALGTIVGTGEIPTLTADGASIQFLGAGTWSSTSSPGRIVFNTTPAATTTPVERFQLAASEAVFNDPGNDYDFRVESDTNTHAFFVQASDGNVGIGTSSPGAQLDIAGTVHVTNADSFISNATTCLFARTSGTGSGIFSEAGHLVLQPRSSAARSIIFGTGSTTATERARFDGVGNFLLNGTISPASGVGTFAIFNGTAPTGSVANGIILYAEDVSSSSELKVRDEAGNVTTLSPHNFSLIPEGPSEDMAWAYYSEKGGKRINVDMLKLARMVEKLTGEKLVYEN